MAAGKGGGNDLGNLFDMLNEAKKGVEAERKQTIDTETELRDRAAREEREREESRLREEAQKKLIEENRRRNEALAKRERVATDKKLATAPHMRPVDEGPKPAQPAAAVSAPVHKVSRLALAAMVIAGIGLGVGGAFAMAPETRGAFVDVDVAARAVVLQTSRAASVEVRIQGELEKARAQIAELEKQFGGAGMDAKKLRAELDRARKDLDLAKAELTALKEAATKPVVRGGGRNGGGGGGGLPTINGNVFK